jgi:hypothetical protein
LLELVAACSAACCLLVLVLELVLVPFAVRRSPSPLAACRLPLAVCHLSSTTLVPGSSLAFARS